MVLGIGILRGSHPRLQSTGAPNHHEFTIHKNVTWETGNILELIIWGDVLELRWHGQTWLDDANHELSAGNINTVGCEIEMEHEDDHDDKKW